MTRKHLITLITVAACLVGTIAMAGGIKDRMIQRKPAINALLAQGVVGENSQGFLEFRAAPQQAGTVNAENADRKAVYQAIAQKAGTSAAVVGQRRAAKIAQQSPGGTWIQKPDGSWYQK